MAAATGRLGFSTGGARAGSRAARSGDGGARWREGGGGRCAPPLAAGSGVLAGCRGEGGGRAGGEVEVRDGSGGGVAEANDDGREVRSDPRYADIQEARLGESSKRCYCSRRRGWISVCTCAKKINTSSCIPKK